LASVAGNLEVAELLLDHGAELEGRCYGEATALACAATEGHDDLVRAFIKRGAKVNVYVANGNSALHQAAVRDHAKVVRVLLEAGATRDLCVVDGTGIASAPLNMAARRNAPGALKALLEAGADPNQVCGWDPPLNQAAWVNSTRMVKALVNAGANVNASGPSGVTALHIAAEKGNAWIVDFLAKAGASGVLRDGRGYSPLHLAVLETRPRAVRKLLELKICDVDGVSNAGLTALQLAAEKPEIAAMLIGAGADVNAAGGPDGLTAAQLVALRGDPATMQLLIDAGADVDVSWNGRNLLDFACSRNNEKMKKFLVSAGMVRASIQRAPDDLGAL
jgi:ankyrin repeat protein